MHRFSVYCPLLTLFLIFMCSVAAAQATRTWVSGVGDDANPCSRTAPCKTFAGAISKTAAGGEIDALDPGGFGALTITKGITIDGGGGQVASVLTSATNGLIVSAGAGDVVTLRNLRINGIKGSVSPGLNGIRFLSGGALLVENCRIFGFSTNGIDIALTATGSSVSIKDTNITNIGGDGIRIATTTGQVQVGIERTRVENSANGVHALDHSRVTIRDSFIEHASGAAVLAESPSGDSIASVDESELSFNNNGLQAGPGGAATYVANSKISFNYGAAFNAAGGVLFSYGTNRVHGNTSVGTFTALTQQ